jgi:hypothetical protein
MDALTDVLRSYLVERPQLGPGRQAEPRDPRAGLTRQLARIGATNQTYFNVCFGAVVVLFVLAIGIVLFFLKSPTQMAAVFGAVGVTVTGLISRMTSLWKHKVSADALLALIPVATEEQLKTVIETLLKRL